MRALELRRLLTRAAILSLLWVVLSGARPDSLLFGVLSVAAATVLSVRIAAEGTHLAARLPGLARLAALFLRDSLEGAVDIAFRALHPRMPLSPAIIEHPLRLPGEPLRVVLADIVSLLPGSLVLDIGARTLRVHLCDDAPVFRDHVGVEERRVAEAIAPVRERG